MDTERTDSLISATLVVEDTHVTRGTTLHRLPGTALVGPRGLLSVGHSCVVQRLLDSRGPQDTYWLEVAGVRHDLDAAETSVSGCYVFAP